MHVLPAKRQDVESRVGKGGASASVFRDEDVAMAVVMQNPADVTALIVAEIEVSFVRDAPDPLTGVVKLARTALPGAPLRIDVLARRCWHHLGPRRDARRLVGARQGERQDAKDRRVLNAPHLVNQYGSVGVWEPETDGVVVREASRRI